MLEKCIIVVFFQWWTFWQYYEGGGMHWTIVYDKLTSHWSISFEIKDHCLPRILGGNCLPSSPLSVCNFYYYTPKTLKSISWAFPGNGHGISVIMGFENVIFLSGSAPELLKWAKPAQENNNDAMIEFWRSLFNCACAELKMLAEVSPTQYFT